VASVEASPKSQLNVWPATAGVENAIEPPEQMVVGVAVIVGVAGIGFTVIVVDAVFVQPFEPVPVTVYVVVVVVFKGVDEQTIDKETSQPMKVALKLMRLKAQFLREISARDKEFNYEFVIRGQSD
jgi:hypothetical protein